MPTDPLTAARFPASSASPNVPQDIQNAVNDLSSVGIPRFANTAARDAAYTAWVAAGHTMTSGLHCTVAGATQVYRGSWKPLADTLSQRIAATATGTLGSGVTVPIAPAEVLPAAPHGTGVPYRIRVLGQIRVDIPAGLGATLSVTVGSTTYELDRVAFASSGSTYALHGEDVFYITTDSAQTVTVNVTANAGTITVTPTGKVIIETAPYTAL